MKTFYQASTSSNVLSGNVDAKFILTCDLKNIYFSQGYRHHPKWSAFLDGRLCRQAWFPLQPIL